MPRVAYDDAALTIWRGSDALMFIDGLSSNKIADMIQGEVRQTVFTTTQAKIVDLATSHRVSSIKKSPLMMSQLVMYFASNMECRIPILANLNQRMALHTDM
jgi:hypothetical protein